MSLITFVQQKNAVAFKEALFESIQQKVDAVLEETKVEVASNLLLGEETLDESSGVFHKIGAKVSYDYIGGGKHTGKVVGYSAGRSGSKHFIKVKRDTKTGAGQIAHDIMPHHYASAIGESTIHEAGGILPDGESVASPEADGTKPGGIQKKFPKVWKKPAVGTHGASSPEPRMPGA